MISAVGNVCTLCLNIVSTNSTGDQWIDNKSSWPRPKTAMTDNNQTVIINEHCQHDWWLRKIECVIDNIMVGFYHNFPIIFL